MTHTVSVIGASVYQNCASDEKKSRQKVFDKISEVFAELGRDQDADFGFIVDDLGHLRSIRHFWFKLVCDDEDRRIEGFRSGLE